MVYQPFLFSLNFTQDVAAAVEEQTALFQEAAANMNLLIGLSKQLNEVAASFRV
jgi:methyl-accepting chemotaxis protein